MVGRSVKRISKMVFMLFLSSLISSSYVCATEGGGSSYAGGNEDFMAGALPPPGFHLINYFLWYNAHEYKDLRMGGVKAKDIFGKEPDFDLNVVCNAFRFLYVTKFKVLGADLGFHVIQPILNIDVDISTPGFSISDSDTGLGDTTFSPFVLGWHFKNWHFVAATDINAPTGDYNAKDAAVCGRGYWNIEPILAFTYLSDGGFEVSSKFMYDFNIRNPDTDYKSGQEFHFDYLVGQHIGNWNFGINGYYYIQTTDDSFSNESAEFDGNRGHALAIGPAIQYNYKNMFFNLKYQLETAVDNRPEGERLWFKFFYAF